MFSKINNDTNNVDNYGRNKIKDHDDSHYFCRVVHRNWNLEISIVCK